MTTLTDREIQSKIDAGRLLKNTDSNRLAGACYELRMGDVYYDLTEDGKRIELQQGELVLIKPGHRVALITLEEFDLPADMLARIISKGSLFSIGLSPVSTYADPGFSGNLGVVTMNISDRYIQLPQGEPIAKVEFTRLTESVAKPYLGQHGYHTGIWPIKTQLHKTHSEVIGDRRVYSERAEALALLPSATRLIIARIENTQAWINVGLIMAILVNAAALFAVNKNWIDDVHAILTNLVASAIIGLGAITTTFIRKT